jgi:hypothetical protein
VTILLKSSSPPLCTLLAERPCLHCHSSKENDAIKVKLRSSDHSSTNSKHACVEGSVTNLKKCYGESAHNFWLTYVVSTGVVWKDDSGWDIGNSEERNSSGHKPSVPVDELGEKKEQLRNGSYVGQNLDLEPLKYEAGVLRQSVHFLSVTAVVPVMLLSSFGRILRTRVQTLSTIRIYVRISLHGAGAGSMIHNAN